MQTANKPTTLAELGALPENQRPKLRLTGRDGNAFFILGSAADVLQKAGLSDLKVAFTKEATQGNYDNLLQTCMKYFNVS